MKKIMIAAILMMALGLTACGQKDAPAAQQSGGTAQLANPWREITEADAGKLCPRLFRVPDGAQNARWSAMGSAADPSGVPGALVQLKFDLDGGSFTARAQRTAEETDVSGMYCEWVASTEGVLKSWGDLPCRCLGSQGESGRAELCLWYDTAAGVSYSLSVTEADLDVSDLLAVAEAMHP